MLRRSVPNKFTLNLLKGKEKKKKCEVETVQYTLETNRRIRTFQDAMKVG